MIPIHVPSKGRPQAATIRLLTEASLHFEVWVEPQDYDAYREAWPTARLVRLPTNDPGLGIVRQKILDQARLAGHEWFWMLDDDITGFFEARDGKNHREDPGYVLGTAAAAIRSAELVGQGALEYQQFAWSHSTGKVTRNSYCDVAVLINTAVMANYRPEMVPKEDRDFTLQVLASGMDTLRTSWLSFSSPANGSNPGGLYDVYGEQGREEKGSRRLETMWPGIVEFKRKKNGRPDAKIHWRRMRKNS